MPIAGRVLVQRSVVLLAIGFLTLLAIVGTTIWLNERAQVHLNEVVAARDTRGAAAELRSALQAAESSQRGFLATSNEIYLAPYDTAKTRALNELDKLKRNLAAVDDVQPLLRRLSSVVDQKVGEMQQTIDLKNQLRDAEASALLRTNRGKALMDEANIFLTGIIQSADDRLTVGVAEQSRNTAMLRLVSVIGALVIIMVVGFVTLTVWRYTREVAAARDEVRLANASLEERVNERTADLARARDRAETFLAEVNHRVANSLALVASMVNLQSRAVMDAAAKEALEETQARIFAVSLVHKHLYSAGDARTVALDEYLSTLLDHLETSMRGEGLGASLRHELEPISLATDASINLGIVLTEWVTNAFKYAYPGRLGEVRVQLRRTGEGRAELAVEDDGVGRDPTSKPQGTGLGSRIVTAMSKTLGAEARYEERQPGTRAVIAFAAQ